MSNSQPLFERTYSSFRFLNIEHGRDRITLAIFDSGKPDRSWDIQVNSCEARELAKELLFRAGELDKWTNGQRE